MSFIKIAEKLSKEFPSFKKHISNRVQNKNWQTLGLEYQGKALTLVPFVGLYYEGKIIDADRSKVNKVFMNDFQFEEALRKEIEEILLNHPQRTFC